MVNYKKTNQCALKYSGQLLKGRGSNTSLSVFQTGQVPRFPPGRHTSYSLSPTGSTYELLGYTPGLGI